jgi:small-conductance mechanosensitive channel
MSPEKLRILQTVVILAVYMFAVLVTRSIVNKTLRKARLEKTRRKIIVKAIHLLLTLTTVVLVAGVWGVDRKELAVFAGTTMTVLGIAFFAQWSLLSNVTSGILLFFNHSLKLGDTVKVFDKDFPFEGEIEDLSYFFVHVRTRTGEMITIPNSVMFQKPFSIIEGGAGGPSHKAVTYRPSTTHVPVDDRTSRPRTGDK